MTLGTVLEKETRVWNRYSAPCILATVSTYYLVSGTQENHSCREDPLRGLLEQSLLAGGGLRWPPLPQEGFRVEPSARMADLFV